MEAVNRDASIRGGLSLLASWPNQSKIASMIDVRLLQR